MQNFFFGYYWVGKKAAENFKKVSQLNNDGVFNTKINDFLGLKNDEYDTELLTPEVLEMVRKLSVRMYHYFSENDVKAKFKKAELIVSESPEGYDEAMRIWDDIIAQSLNGTIDFENFLPAAVSRYLIRA